MKAVLMCAVAPLLWGTTYTVTTELLPGFDPFLVAAIRALPVGLILTILGWERPRGKWVWRTVVLGVLNIGAFFALLFVAAYRMPGGVVATLGAAQPLIVLFGNWLFFNRLPKALSLFLAGIGILGVALLVLTPGATLDRTGLLAAAGAAVAMAFGVLLTKRWGRPVSLLIFTGWQLTVGGAFVAAIALATAPVPASLTLDNWIGFAWLSLLNTGLAYYFWFRGIESLREAWQASVLGLLSPVVATAVGWILLSETLTGMQLLGVLAIVAGVALSQIVEGSRRTGTSTGTLRNGRDL